MNRRTEEKPDVQALDSNVQELDPDALEQSRLLLAGFGVAFVLLGGYVVISAGSLPDAIAARDPGPAAVPRALGLATLILGAGTAVQAFRKRTAWRQKVLVDPIVAFGIFGLFVLVLPVAGFNISTALFAFVLLMYLRRGKVLQSAIFSVGISVVTSLIFGTVLGIPL